MAETTRSLAVVEKINAFPPQMCRLFARTGPKNNQRPMSNIEIAHAARMSPSLVAKLSKMATWSGVTFSTYLRFVSACRIDPLDVSELKKWLRRPTTKLRYWDNATWRQRKMILRIRESCRKTQI